MSQANSIRTTHSTSRTRAGKRNGQFREIQSQILDLAFQTLQARHVLGRWTRGSPTDLLFIGSFAIEQHNNICQSTLFNMTDYRMNAIFGNNCLLQDPKTDKFHIDRIHLAIGDGSDCQVCLLDYHKNDKKFYNRLFMPALCDAKGRSKNYLGVQCEVSAEIAACINRDVQKF